MSEDNVDAAKRRVAERRKLRGEAASKARQLPSIYQRRLSEEFRQAAREAQMITRMNNMSGYER